MDIIRTYYEITPRQYSANAVSRVEVTLDKDKKEVLHRTLVLVPSERKEKGDIVAAELCEFYNNKIKSSVS